MTVHQTANSKCRAVRPASGRCLLQSEGRRSRVQGLGLEDNTAMETKMCSPDGSPDCLMPILHYREIYSDVCILRSAETMKVICTLDLGQHFHQDI